MADFQSYEGEYSAPPPAAMPESVSSAPQPGAYSAPEAPASMIKDKKFILRLVEIFFAIVAVSCAASAAISVLKLGFHSFIVFTAVISIIFDVVFIVLYVRGHTLPPQFLAKAPIAELATSAIIALFWFAGGIAYAVGANSNMATSGKTNGAAAFAIFSFFAWSASSFFAFKRFRSGDATGTLAYSDL